MECFTCMKEDHRRRGSQILLVTIFLIFISEARSAAVISFTTFRKDFGCYMSGNQSLVLAKCLVKKTARSFLHCVSLCGASVWCSGAAKDALSICYFYSPCDYVTIGSCRSQGLNVVQIYRKQVDSTSVCGKEGTVNIASSTCTCSPGWSGVYCETPPSLCKGADVTVGVFWSEVKLYNTIRVLCDVAKSGDVKIYVFKNDGTSYHNRTWAQYSEGYAINGGNFWVGLENMRTILSQNVTNMRLEVLFNNSAIYYYWDYKGVAISNSSNYYRITYVSSKLNSSTFSLLGSSNCINSGKQFSTPDSDNDGDSDNLAAKGNAGWWFEDTVLFNTLICNPLGRQPWLTPASVSSTQMTFPQLELEQANYDGDFTSVGMYFYK